MFFGLILTLMLNKVCQLLFTDFKYESKEFYDNIFEVLADGLKIGFGHGPSGSWRTTIQLLGNHDGNGFEL
jgi:hypothetical protein